MKRKLLCLALVLTMAVAVFVPAASALAEGTGQIYVILDHDDVSEFHYGDIPWYRILFMDETGAFLEDDYMEAPCELTLSDSTGAVVWSGQWDTVYDFNNDTVNQIRFDTDEAKIWVPGDYTMAACVIVGGETLRDSFRFYYAGWNGAEPEQMDLYVDAGFSPYRISIRSEVRVTSLAGDPAQACEVSFRLLDESGKEVRVSNGPTFSNGLTGAWFDLYDGEDAYGTYTVEASVTDSTGKSVTVDKTVEFGEKNKPQVLTVIDDTENLTYCYWQDVDLTVRITDKDGNPAQAAEMEVAILRADDASLAYPPYVYHGWCRTDNDGYARIGLRLDFEDFSEGNYVLRLSIDEMSVDVEFTYMGKVEPKAITAYEGVCDTYYLDGDVYLSFLVTGENDMPVANEEVLFEILNADGTPSDVAFIYPGETSRYDWTERDGTARVNLDFSMDPDFPLGEYILQVSVGEIKEQFPFELKQPELQFILDVYGYTMETDRLGYGDELRMDTHVRYGYHLVSAEGTLHWWIENSDGKTVYDAGSSYCGDSSFIGSWVMLDESDIPDIKAWKDGIYTVVAERTVGSETLHAEYEFSFVAWNGSGYATQMTVVLSQTTFAPGDDLTAVVTVTDSQGLPVQGQYVSAYLLDKNGENVYVCEGWSRSFLYGRLGSNGTAVLGTWFDNGTVSTIPSGTYTLEFRCGGMTERKTIVLEGFDGTSAGPKEAPDLTVTSKKASYGPDDVFQLSFQFSGASEEILAAYRELLYVRLIVWVDTTGYYLYPDENSEFSLESFEEIGLEPGTYTIEVETFPEMYGWYAATASFTIQYTGRGGSNPDPGPGGDDKPTAKLGDINGNGQIEATDYLLLKRFVLGTFTLNDEQKKVADVNGDHQINALDYMLLKRHVLGTYKIA